METQSDSLRDPIESAGLFEGDIANVNIADLRRLRSGDYTKNAIRELWKKWPDATIPYVISSQFGSYERSVIAKAMKTYHSKTCIKFIPRTSQAAYIHLIKGSVLHSRGRGLFRGVATPAILCHKEQSRALERLLLAGSLWHMDSWLPCTERPLCQKEPTRSKPNTPIGA